MPSKLQYVRSKGAYDSTHFSIATAAGRNASKVMRAFGCLFSNSSRDFDVHASSAGVRPWGSFWFVR